MNFSEDEMGLIWKALHTRLDSTVYLMRRELEHRSDTASHKVIERFDQEKQHIHKLLNRIRQEFYHAHNGP